MLTINHANIVTPERVIDNATLVLEDQRIATITTRPINDRPAIDAAGNYVLPGLVDLHSDAIETQLAPRPGAEVPEELAFLEADRSYAAAGITTAFDSLAFIDKDERSVKRSRELFDLVVRAREEALVRHELHLRVEITDTQAIAAAENLLPLGQVRMASIMDHGPAGWYTGPGAHAAGSDCDEPDPRATWTSFERLNKVAAACGVPLASHDDWDTTKIERLADAGYAFCEMPLNIEAARLARERGLFVYMGAPNLLRGRSYVGNMSAMDAARSGVLNGLCSDYHPPTMLQSAFKLAREHVMPLPQAVKLVSSAPAEASGITERGRIQVGQLADLIIVGVRLGTPVVTHTIVGGRTVHTTASNETRNP